MNTPTNMNISMDKKYRYRRYPHFSLCRVLCTNRNHPVFKVVSLATSGSIIMHTSDGRVNSDGPEDPCDLIEVIPQWRGKAWVHPDGRIREITQITIDEANHWGWRMITAIEERKDQPA